MLFLPGPVTVAPEVLAAAARPLIDHRGPQYAAMLARMTQRLQAIFGTRSDVLMLGSSGTGGLEAAIGNLFSPGDHLLAAPVGFFGKRLVAIARAFGCEVEEVATDAGARLDAAALAQRLDADPDRRIVGVLLTHNETSTGVQNDLAALVPALRRHGAYVVVDSVSGLGASEMHMDAWGLDIVVSASQKGLAAPPGIAMVAVGERAWARIARTSKSCFYFNLATAREFAGKGQTPWTPPISIAFALDVALENYEREGATQAFARHARFAQRIRSAFEALGFTIFSQPDAHSVTVVAARPPQGIDAQTLLKTLREQYGLVLSGGQGELAGKIVRMGTMGALDDAMLERALDLVGQSVQPPTHRGAGSTA